MEVIIYLPDDKHEIGMVVIETRKYRKYIRGIDSKVSFRFFKKFI